MVGIRNLSLTVMALIDAELSCFVCLKHQEDGEREGVTTVPNKALGKYVMYPSFDFLLLELGL